MTVDKSTCCSIWLHDNTVMTLPWLYYWMWLFRGWKTGRSKRCCIIPHMTVYSCHLVLLHLGTDTAKKSNGTQLCPHGMLCFHPAMVLIVKCYQYFIAWFTLYLGVCYHVYTSLLIHWLCESNILIRPKRLDSLSLVTISDGEKRQGGSGNKICSLTLKIKSDISKLLIRFI